MTQTIKQILNNNVVSAIDAASNERILTGRGLGFEAYIGDIVSEDKVEKTFHLHDDKITSRFMVLLNELPVEIIQLTDDIVRLAQQDLDYKLSEGLYVSLSDHLHYAIERQKQGQEYTILWSGKFATFIKKNIPSRYRRSRSLPRAPACCCPTPRCTVSRCIW